MLRKILLIGTQGQLGWELQHTLALLGQVVGLDFPKIDLADYKSIRQWVLEIKPDLIINAAAYTNVDKAESEPELARRVNAIAPGVMAEETRKLNATFIHYSTDYVFDGTKGSPYVETDTPNPINVYGASKWEGEQLVQAAGGTFLIFRTSWLFSMRHGGFVLKVLQWAREQETLRIVDDQIGSPTWSRMLAEATAQIIAQGRGTPTDFLRERTGLYHLAGSGSCTRYEWGKAILELDPKKEEQVVKEILPAKSSDFPTPAKRPANSVLDISVVQSIFNIHMTNWKKQLTDLILE
jgi:dTDP-4-dehydrorhamnose reductase